MFLALLPTYRTRINKEFSQIHGQHYYIVEYIKIEVS